MNLIGVKIAGNNFKISNNNFKISKEISFTKYFKRIAFKNKWEWNRNTKRNIYIPRKRQQIIDRLGSV